MTYATVTMERCADSRGSNSNRECLCPKRNCAAKKQSSAKRKRNGCRPRLRPRRGSNLPNNGVSWPTGLKETPTDRFRSARLQSPNRCMPCTQKTFGMTGLRRVRLEVCEPHWYVARGAYGCVNFNSENSPWRMALSCHHRREGKLVFQSPTPPGQCCCR
jgi:hypothetical protein